MTMNAQQLIVWALVSIVAGGLAYLAIPGVSGNVIAYLIAGIVGGFVGGWLFGAMGWKLNLGNEIAEWIVTSAVGAIIVGARLGESEHRADNLKLFSFALDVEDKRVIDAALDETNRIPGDCGQEYRRPPYLTASGDLSHHLAELPKPYTAVRVPDRPHRLRVRRSRAWERR